MSNGMEGAKLQAMQATSSATSLAPTPPPALDQILSHVSDNNSRLQDILSNVQAFTARTLGEDTPAGPGTETVQPQGMLGNIHAALNAQTVLIGELQEAVRALGRIG